MTFSTNINENIIGVPEIHKKKWIMKNGKFKQINIVTEYINSLNGYWINAKENYWEKKEQTKKMYWFNWWRKWKME